MAIDFVANGTQKVDWAIRNSNEWTSLLKSTSPEDDKNQFLIVSRMPVSNKTIGGVSEATKATV